MANHDDRHLWDIVHRPLCEHDTFYPSAIGWVGKAQSWHDYMNDPECKMAGWTLVRWDWHVYEEIDVVCLHWINPHCGLFRWQKIPVRREEEQTIRAWLWTHHAIMQTLWEPFHG